MQRLQIVFAIAVVAMGVLVAACATTTGAATTQGNGAPPTIVAATPTAGAATTPPTSTVGAASSATPVATAPAAGTPAATASSASGTASSSASGTPIRYEVASGTTANYRVREQLANLSAPNDAVGKTSEVSGSIVVTTDGKVVSDQSKITVDLTSLASDSGMRDRFIQSNTLQTSSYPTAVFVPTEIKGLSAPLPTSGEQTFQLVGDLTVHGVTKSVTWDVTAQVEGDDVTGQATTSVKFGDFGMSQPRVASVLSVADDIKLELSFHLTRSA